MDRVVARRLLGPGWTSRMMQAILHELLTDRDVDGADRRRTGGLRPAAGRAGGGGAGRGRLARRRRRHQRWLRVADERSAIVQLAAVGIRVAGGAPFQLGETQDPHIRVTVGMLRDEIETVGAALAVAQRA